MSSPSAYLVTGATGAQGGSVARELLKAGQRVHALVRDATKPEAKELESLGAVLFVGDFDSVEVINKAAVGVKGIFINPFPVFTDEDGEAKQTQHFVDAANAAGTVESLVISTAFKTGEHTKWLAEDANYEYRQYYHSKAAAEDVVRNSGVRYWTVLRPPWLNYNYVHPHSDLHFPELHAERKFVTGIKRDLPLAHLDAHDIGLWATAAFLNPAQFASKILRPAAENATLEQIVRELEKFSGVKVESSFVDPSELAKLSKNPSDPWASVRAHVAAWQNKVGAEISAEELEEIKSYGIPLTTFPEFLAKNKAAVYATLKIGS